MKLTYFRPIAILALGVIVATGCGDGPRSARTSTAAEPPRPTVHHNRPVDSMFGVTISRTDRELQELFNEWQELGISAVFASAEFSASGGFRALSRKNALDLFVRVPVFLAPDLIAANPELAAMTDRGEPAGVGSSGYACPSRTDFRERRIEDALDIVKRLRPEGILLENVHHFVAWESLGLDDDVADLPETCFCVHCLQGFAASLGIPRASIPPQPERAARWIRTNALDRWRQFRIETITSMVADLAEAIRDLDPEIVIVVGVVPWRRDDFAGAGLLLTGQDYPALGQIADYLSPSTSSLILHRPSDWIGSVVRDIDWVSECPVLPMVRVPHENEGDDAVERGEFEAALQAALETPSAGIVLDTWSDVEADPELGDIVRGVFSGP